MPPNADMRNFNENDILGQLDRDDKGNLIIDEDNLQDKDGKAINERGYLLSEEGDIVENQTN